MNKKVLFVLFAVLMMAVMTVSVSADQDAYDRFCNMDQYGCWNTNDEGGKDYIMFWSESARDYFMGPGSNAVVTDYCADCSGKLGMGSGAPVVNKASGSAQKAAENTSGSDTQTGTAYNDDMVTELWEYEVNKGEDPNYLSELGPKAIVERYNEVFGNK